jgi:DNA-binding transcriptional ArsR family regulator
MHLSTLRQLKVISDPRRVELLHQIVDKPRTVKQIAELLGVPATKLYYHMKELEEAGFVRIVDTRLKSGILEKYYLATARRISVERDLLYSRSEGEDARETVIAATIDATGDELRRSLSEGLMEWPVGDKESGGNAFLSRSLLTLRKRDIPVFIARFERLIEEFREAKAPGGATYGCTIAFYPRVAGAERRKVSR